MRHTVHNHRLTFTSISFQSQYLCSHNHIPAKTHLVTQSTLHCDTQSLPYSHKSHTPTPTNSSCSHNHTPTQGTHAITGTLRHPVTTELSLWTYTQSHSHKQWHPTPAYTAPLIPLPHTHQGTQEPTSGVTAESQAQTTKTTHKPWRHESQPHTRSGHTVTTVLTPQEQGEQATSTTGTHAVSPPVTRTLHPTTHYHIWLQKNHQTDTLETGGYTCTVADTHTRPYSHKDTFRTAHPQPAPACAHRSEAPDTPRPRPGLPDPSPSASPGRVRVLAELTSSPRRQERRNVRPLWALGIVVQSHIGQRQNGVLLFLSRGLARFDIFAPARLRRGRRHSSPSSKLEVI